MVEDKPIEIPEDFISFYNQFHTDTAYQLQHILFPLQGIPSLKAGDDITGMQWWFEKDGWKYHKPFNDMDGTYTRSFDNFAGIITETIVDNTGQFTMVRRFTKSSEDEWTLIYYKEMGAKVE